MTVLTISDVLSAASLTGMAELNAVNLNELFSEAIRAEYRAPDHPQPLSKLSSPKKAEEIRKFWADLCANGTFTKDHPVCKEDNAFTKNPKCLILVNKQNHNTFNSLACFGLGNKTNNRSGTSYKNKDEQKVGSGSSGSGPSGSGPSGSGPSSSGNTISTGAAKLISQANEKKDSGKSTGKSRTNSNSSSSNGLDDFSKSLTEKFQELLQSEVKSWSNKYDRIEEDLNKVTETADNAAKQAQEAKTAANDNTTAIDTVKEQQSKNTTEISDLKKELDSQTNKLAGLTNDFHALDGAAFNPDTIDGYTLVQYYVLSKNSRSDYRKAVLSMRLNGLIVLDVNPDENDRYIDIDVENPRSSEAKTMEIETKLAVDCHGNFDRTRRVKIKKATVIQRKNERYTILVQIDAVNKIRGTIVQRLINDRHLNQGHFGLRQDIPEQYNIDPWLMWLKNNAIDSATGRKLIYGFDTNKSGYYVVYINDHQDKTTAEGAVNTFTGKPYTDKEKCSIIRPGCPREFAKLKLKYLNLEDLLKLTKPDEYFCYGGHILKVPGDDMLGGAGAR